MMATLHLTMDAICVNFNANPAAKSAFKGDAKFAKRDTPLTLDHIDARRFVAMVYYQKRRHVKIPSIP